MLPGEPAIVRPVSGGPQPHMIPIVPGVPGLTGRTQLAERVERHMADKGDPHGTMVMVNEAIRGLIRNEADPLFSDWLAKHNVVEVETDPVFTKWVNSSNVRLGEGSSATSTTATALGCNAKCSADGSVQLGDGTNLTRTSLQFRNANLFVHGSGSVASLGTGFPRASASAYGAVKIGDGLKVVDGVVSSDAQPNVIETVKVDGVPLHVSDDKSVDIRSTGMISDADGSVIRADGSAVVIDGSWTCNGVLLTKKEGRDDYWENAESHWGLGYDPSAKWAFTNGSGHARLDAPADATKLSFVIGGVTYDATIGRADSVVMAGDVVPKGGGTETIATIGGKDIKAPASPVSSVNGKTGVVVLDAAAVGARPASWTPSASDVGARPDSWTPSAQEVGALPLTGGTLTGDLVIGDKERPASRKLTVGADGGANGIQLTGGNVSSGSSMTIGGSSGTGGALVVEDGGSGNASIKKGGKEVATEEYVDGMAKYPVVQKSGTTVMLEDRQVNVYSGTLSSDVTLVLPAANADGRVRDLEFRANVSGLRLVGVRRTDASGASVALFSMSPESVPAEDGVNAWYFTETGGEIRVERAMLKPAGFQVKMDFTCTSNTSVSNDVDFLDSAGETIKSIKFQNQTLSEIVSGVSSLRINMSEYGSIVMNGTTYYKSSPELLSAIPLTVDSVITASSAEYCLAPDTPILSPSGPVALKDVRVGDAVIGVDADGRVCTTTVTRCDTDMEKWADSCDRWMFVRENGENAVVTTVRRHRFYNVERGAMVYMDEWNVGEHGRDPDGRVLELVSHEHVDEPTRHMTLFTGTQTYFAGGLLSGNRHTPHIDWEDR